MKIKGTVKENKELVLKLIQRPDLSLEDIGKMFDPPRTKQRISIVLREWGVQKQRKKVYKVPKSKIIIPREELANLYHVEKKSIEDIAEMKKVSISLIYSRMREYGIPRRSLSDASAHADKNTRKVCSIPRPARGPWKYIAYKDALYPFDRVDIEGLVRIEVEGKILKAFQGEDLVGSWKLKRKKRRGKKPKGV